jgi:hypothetical protein
MVATAKVNPYVAIICNYMRAVALNLQLDDAVRQVAYLSTTWCLIPLAKNPNYLLLYPHKT